MGTPERELAGGRQKAASPLAGRLPQGTLNKPQTSARGGQRGQDNFKLAANSGYNSRGSADPRESLRKRRILKLALTAHKVLLANSAIGFLAVYWL